MRRSLRWPVLRLVEVWRCGHCSASLWVYLAGERGRTVTRAQAVRAGWQVLPGRLSLRRLQPRLTARRRVRATPNKFDSYNCPNHRSHR